ncbi:hypothetical protein [Arenibacter sp. F26102]|nr:hypothetical protein [Arenibacter sp. F26102]
MKKLFFVAVMSIGSLTAFAQTGEAVAEVGTEVAVTQDSFS